MAVSPTPRPAVLSPRERGTGRTAEGYCVLVLPSEVGTNGMNSGEWRMLPYSSAR